MGPSNEPVYYEPERLCAVVLQELKRIAGLREGANAALKKAVIAVPVTFNQEQHKALQKACQLSGIEL